MTRAQRAMHLVIWIALGVLFFTAFTVAVAQAGATR